MPKNNTKSVLKSLLKRRNAPKWAKNKRRRLSDDKRPLSDAEHLANFLISKKLFLCSSIFQKLPKRWFKSHRMVKPIGFSDRNNMLQSINNH